MILVEVAEPETEQACIQHHDFVVDDERRIRTDRLGSTAFAERPRVDGFAALQPVADTAMPNQIPRTRRCGYFRKVSGPTDHVEPQVAAQAARRSERRRGSRAI